MKHKAFPYLRIKKILACYYGLLVEVDASSRALIKQPEGASWVGCVVALRKTKLGLMKAAKKIRVYHIKVQPFIGEAMKLLPDLKAG